MIKGIGIDIVELRRIEEKYHRNERLKDRILTAAEQEIFEGLPHGRKIEYLAGRFAAKEAYAKAYGTGIGGALSFLDIEIAADENGKPYIVKPSLRAHLSISHSKEYAVAQVIIEAE